LVLTRLQLKVLSVQKSWVQFGEASEDEKT
jgi:hypothetical protein